MEQMNIDKGTIGVDSPVYGALIASMRNALETLDAIKTANRASLHCDRYYSGTEMMNLLHVSRRTLQEYRDKGILPYTTIGGTILYPESEVRAILERNYQKAPCCIGK